jgi:CobQ-like glutamine amidotransferase family enzyme
VRVCVLYPRELNLYADSGNLVVLQRRCEWRGIGFCASTAGIGDAVDADEHDLYYIGGGQDADQRRCATDLLDHKAAAIVAAAARGALVVGVGGGYQLLGHSVELDGHDTLPGLGLLDARTVRVEGPRLVGDAVIEVVTPTGPRHLVGFENHAGRTYLEDETQPLGRVRVGHGNNGNDGLEGARKGSVIGTYLHGPLLAKNAWFADVLLQLATGVPELPPLDDEFEDAAHDVARHLATP